MTEIIKEGSGHRTHIKSPLMRESLMDRKVVCVSEDRGVRGNLSRTGGHPFRQ